ncbi:hypothetical protein AABB24_024450, partial [Solanum stoloniferum]
QNFHSFSHLFFGIRCSPLLSILSSSSEKQQPVKTRQRHLSLSFSLSPVVSILPPSPLSPRPSSSRRGKQQQLHRDSKQPKKSPTPAPPTSRQHQPALPLHFSQARQEFLEYCTRRIC